jgi:DNA gyrase/topoisomerase IV subunit A
MEAELIRLRFKLDDEVRREHKLGEYLKVIRQQLAAEKQELSQLTEAHDGSIKELLDLDAEENASRYYKLVDQKQFLEEQIRSSEPLQKRYIEAVEKELAQLREQNEDIKAKIEEQKKMATVQGKKLAEAKSGFGRMMESRPSETLASEEEFLPNSFVSSRASLKKRLSIRSRATKPALSSDRPTAHASNSKLYGLIFGSRAK